MNSQLLRYASYFLIFFHREIVESFSYYMYMYFLAEMKFSTKRLINYLLLQANIHNNFTEPEKSK